jgi:hypothetical protein
MHNVGIKFLDDRFRHLRTITAVIASISEFIMLVLLIEGILEVHGWDGFVWQDIHAKSHEDWCGSLSDTKGLHQKFERV